MADGDSNRGSRGASRDVAINLTDSEFELLQSLATLSKLSVDEVAHRLLSDGLAGRVRKRVGDPDRSNIRHLY